MKLTCTLLLILVISITPVVADDIDKWTQDLKDPNPAVRIAAIENLGTSKHRMVDPLIQALNDNDSDVRAHAAIALGMLKDTLAVVPLIQALNDSDEHVRGSVVSALEWINDTRAVEPLIDILNGDSDMKIRENAAEALGHLKDTRAVKPLIQALKGGDNTIAVGEMKSKVAEALGHLKDTRAVEPLIQTLKDYNKTPEIWNPGFKTSLIQGDNVTLLTDNSLVRWIVVGALGWLRDIRAVEPLIQSLKDPDPTVRSEAASALGWLNDTRAVGPLIQALNDSDYQVRSDAAISLGALGDPRAVDPLIQAFYREADSEVRDSSICTAITRLKPTAECAEYGDAPVIFGRG